jgi:hypothetical protein
VVDERGRLYTVGGTSGINYFMDVFSLDLTRFVEKKTCYEKTVLRIQIWDLESF